MPSDLRQTKLIIAVPALCKSVVYEFLLKYINIDAINITAIEDPQICAYDPRGLSATCKVRRFVVNYSRKNCKHDV